RVELLPSRRRRREPYGGEGASRATTTLPTNPVDLLAPESLLGLGPRATNEDRMQGSPSGRPPMNLPRPGRALQGVLLGLLAIWLVFALAINWGGAQGALFLALCSNSEAVLQGQVW